MRSITLSFSKEEWIANTNYINSGFHADLKRLSLQLKMMVAFPL